MATKSQQKKQRREAQKEKEKSELDTVADKHEAEVEIGPIMGRKKKQRKEKVNSAGGGSTPVASRPQSPGSQEMVGPEKRSIILPVVNQSPTSHSQQTEIESAAKKAAESKGKGKAKSEESVLAEPPASATEAQDIVEKPIPTPTSVLQDLVSSGLIPDPDKLVVLRAPASVNQRADSLGDLQDLDHKLIITEDDRATLQAGKPVHKVSQGTGRIMLTPNGDCVRNLTPTEEERYLELQSRIRNDSGPTAFVPPRSNAGTGFTLIGGRAVPNGPPTFFPPVDKAGVIPPIDPVSRIQRDEALNYINQYVLPSLSTNSQLERALNANAFDTEILRPKDSQSWGGYNTGIGHGIDVLGTQGEHHMSSEAPYGASSNDGVLARGLESMTAHFAVERDNSRGQPLGNVTLLSLADSESALQNAKKETEKLEKSFNQLLKKNRRLLLGTGH